MTGSRIRALLKPGDLRTVGHVPEVVPFVAADPKLAAPLVDCLFDVEPAVRMRAADALEKISREQSTPLQTFADVLLGVLEESEQQEVLWHVAVLLPRLHLTAEQRRRTVQALNRCLAARSSIVKTLALQGMADLAAQDPALAPLTVNLLFDAERTGTPAMRARARKLIARFTEKT